MSVRATVIGVCFLPLWIPNIGVAQTSGGFEAMVEQAITVYRQALDEADRVARLKLFSDAAQLFGQAADLQLESGIQPSADLWANVGHAAWQAEQLGPAILAYRRALAANPRHSAAASNLQLARQRLPTHLQPHKRDSIWSALFFWNDVLAGQANVWAAICFCIAMIMWAIAIRTGRSMYRSLATVPTVLWLALLVSAYVAFRTNDRAAAVLVRPDIMARTADSSKRASSVCEPTARRRRGLYRGDASRLVAGYAP